MQSPNFVKLQNQYVNLAFAQRIMFIDSPEGEDVKAIYITFSNGSFDRFDYEDDSSYHHDHDMIISMITKTYLPK
jgi:hypothetical protein